MSRRLLALLTAWVFVPAAPAADTGTITGALEKPAAATAISAVNRANDKKYPGKVDKKTGKFIIAGLPVKATYDLIVDACRVRLEGVNLKVRRSEYEEEQPLTKEDVATIKKKARELNQFEDKVEIMCVVGNIQHAAVVLNKLRTRPFVESKPGEVIWRLELWHFERPEETWFKVQDKLFQVLYRERLQKAAFDRKALTLDAALGGIKLTGKRPSADVGKIVLPAKDPGIRLRPVK